MTITTAEQWTVTIEEEMGAAEVDMFFGLYEEAFGPLRTLAAARQVLHANEFREEMNDPRILKYVVRSAGGTPLALSTLTNDLTTVPWVSPEYYAAKYPERAARNAVYYLGFTLVRNDSRLKSVFRGVVDLLIERMASEDAVLCLDVCAHNDGMGFAEALRRMGHATQTPLDVVDTQTYYVADFTIAASQLSKVDAEG